MHLQCLVFQPRYSVERHSGAATFMLRALAASNRDDRLGLTAAVGSNAAFNRCSVVAIDMDGPEPTLDTPSECCVRSPLCGRSPQGQKSGIA